VSLAWPLVTVLATGGLGVACTETQYDTTIIEVERPAFNAPADSINGFLGLYNVADNRTTCGNCHADFQVKWATSAHADAWAGLQNSGHAQPFCEGCHTVSELGNAVVEAGGYNAVPDSTYHNVQCESCHGPGLAHLEAVNAGIGGGPLAAIFVDTLGTNGCAGCHEGSHHPYVEQWSQSKHGYGGVHFLPPYGDRTGCNACHEGRAAIALTFGVDADFVEKSQATNWQPITCSVCHDPHSGTYQGQMRADLAEPSRNNLCVKCHAREGHPPSSNTTRRGPHAAQGLLVIDEDVGYKPPNFQYDGRIAGSHGTEGNPRLCASCHVYQFDVTDPNGGFLLTSVGHTFEAIQCLDAQGLPTAGPCDLAERQFGGCAVSGCHTTQDAARAAYLTGRNRMNFLVDLLWADTDGDGVMERTDGGLLPKVLGQAIDAGNLNEINLYDGVLTPAEGAIWNAQLAYTGDRLVWSNFSVAGQLSCNSTTTPACTTQGGANTAHPSSGAGSHNPFLNEALILASIQHLQDYYGVSAPAVDLTPALAAPPSLRAK
jgi:predicted CXXCH cytochrome family protein